MIISRKVSDFGTFAQILQKSHYGYYDEKGAPHYFTFTEYDIRQAIEHEQFESRAFQDSTLEAEYRRVPLFAKDQEQWYREFHIKRIAYLVVNAAGDPIKLNAEGIVTDGNHRLLAATVKGDIYITCEVH